MAEQIRKRNEIDARYTWDLSHIYASCVILRPQDIVFHLIISALVRVF